MSEGQEIETAEDMGSLLNFGSILTIIIAPLFSLTAATPPLLKHTAAQESSSYYSCSSSHSPLLLLLRSYSLQLSFTKTIKWDNATLPPPHRRGTTRPLR